MNLNLKIRKLQNIGANSILALSSEGSVSIIKLSQGLENCLYTKLQIEEVEDICCYGKKIFCLSKDTYYQLNTENLDSENIPILRLTCEGITAVSHINAYKQDLYAISQSGIMLRWDFSRGRNGFIHFDSTPTEIKHDPQGGLIAIGHQCGTVSILEDQELASIGKIIIGESAIKDIEWISQGEFATSLKFENKIHWYHPDNNGDIYFKSPITAMKKNPTSNTIAFAGYKFIEIWDTNRREKISEIETDDFVVSIDWIGDNQIVAALNSGDLIIC